MKDVRDSEGISPELVRFIDESPIDSSDIGDGRFKPARVDVPRPSEIIDSEVRPASTEEDDDDNLVEIKSGTAESGQEAGWYEVEFENSFGGITDRPIITATAVHRFGDFDSAEFEPPSFEIELVDLIGIGDISVDGIETGDVDLGSISIEPPQVSDRDIEHDIDVADSRIDIDVPELDGDFSLDDFDIDIGSNIREIDIDERIDLDNIFSADDLKSEFEGIGDWSFEDTLREATRETGEELFQAGSSNFGVLPSTPDVEGSMISAWDSIMQVTYGKGETEYSGTGWVEWIWAEVGREIDDRLESEFGNRIFDQGRIAEEVESEFSRVNNDLIAIFTDFEAGVEGNVNDMVNDIVDEIEILQSDTDAGFSEIVGEVEAAQEELAFELEDEVANVLLDLQDEIETFGADVEDNILDMDEVLEDIEFEIGDLSTELQDELDLLSEDINRGFDGVSEDLAEELDIFAGDLEFEVNDTLEDVEVGTNDRFEEIEAEVNESLDDVNKNIEDMENRVNTALTDVTALAETAINDSLDLLYSTMGMPKGELMVPVQIRNVSNDSFEFLGYEGGTEINWTAVGRTEGEIEVGDADGIVDDVIRRLIEEGIIDGDRIDSIDI